MPVLLLLIVVALMFVALAFLTLLVGLLPFLLLLAICGAGLAVLAFWIWMLVDAIQNPGLGEGEKIGWVLAIVFLHPIAAILYFFIAHPKRNLPRPAVVSGI